MGGRFILGVLLISLALPNSLIAGSNCGAVRQQASIDCDRFIHTIDGALEKKSSAGLENEMEEIGIETDLLLCALIDMESNGKEEASRFEPRFFQQYVVSDRYGQRRYSRFLEQFDLKDTEETRRRYSSSYGLLQIMYPSAVLEGFRSIPEELLNPQTNISIGIRHLQRAYAKAKVNYPATVPRERFLWLLRRWNGGIRERTLCYAYGVENVYEDLAKNAGLSPPFQ